MKRLIGCLIALVAVFGLSLTVPQPAAADGIIGGGAKMLCQYGGPGPLTDVIDAVTGEDNSGVCDVIGHAVEKQVNKAWKSVWDSVLGDVVNSAADVVKWVIKKVLTVALLGPSVDLKGTGLFGRDATLAGMLTWLGLVIAAAGAMWQIGKMAVTGQARHVGRAMRGWVENTILSAIGVGMVAVLLTAGDALTSGLVNQTFDSSGGAYERIIAVLVPAGVANPITLLCVVAVLLLIGFIQLIMVFLRQSAIPIQCLLLPVAGGGRAGGDAMQKWAPRLITSICVTIIYKPMLAVIICVGFSEFGHAHTLAEWLRGCATLVLGILAPGPLTRIFAPFGEAVGAGMSSGGMSGALGSAGAFLAGRMSKDGDDGGAGGDTQSPMDRAKYVEQSMGPQGKGGQGGDGDDGGSGGQGSDAQSQAARNNANNTGQSGSQIPGQTGGSPDAGTTTGTQAGQAAGVANGAGAAGPAVAAGIQVFDGVNQGIQGASGQIGNGGNTQ